MSAKEDNYLLISIDITKIIEIYNSGNKYIKKADKNGHVYASATVFINDESDEWGNDVKIKIADEYIGGGSKKVKRAEIPNNNDKLDI